MSSRVANNPASVPSASAIARRAANIIRFHIWCDSTSIVPKQLEEVLRAIGYEVDLDEIGEASVDLAGAELVIADESMPRLSEHAQRLAHHRVQGARIGCLSLSGLTPAMKRALRPLQAPLLEPALDPYTTLERIAPVLGINIRTDAFVSYSRRDQTLADALIEGLSRQGLRPWIDRRDLLASEEWVRALRRGVESSDSFLMLVSSASLASKFCVEELSWAEELGKRIVPVIIEDVPSSEISEAISKRQFITLAVDDGGSFALSEGAIERIASELSQDPQDVRFHLDLLTAAIDWKKSGLSEKLLRGRDLRNAEEWLDRMSARRREPLPVALHTELIAASRAASRRRTRIGLGLAATAVVVTLALAIWATLNALQAGRERNTAQGRLAEQRAFGAFVDWDTDPVRAFLQAESAVRSSPADDLQRPGYAIMTASLAARLPEFVSNLETEISSAEFSDDLSRIVVQPVLGSALLFTLGDPASSPLRLSGGGDDLRFVDYAFSSDRRRLAALGRDRFAKEGDPVRLVVWDTLSGGTIASASLAYIQGNSPDLLGFAGDSNHVVVETSASQDYSAYVIPMDATSMRRQEPWHSRARFLLGQLDLESSTVLRVEPEADGASRIELLNLISGAPAFSWSPLKVQGSIVQAYLTAGAQALMVLMPGANSGSVKLSAFRLTSTKAEPIGEPLEGPGPIFVYRAARDGSAAAVIDGGADYPAELWLTAERKRLTVPTARKIDSPFTVKTGEEFRPVDLTSDDRFVVARDPIDPQHQQILLFERTSMRLTASPFRLPLSYETMGIGKNGTTLATVSHDGLVERWDLLQHRLPEERILPVPGMLLSGAFLADRRTLVTESRVKQQGGFAAQIDLWNTETGEHTGGLPDLLDIRTEYAVDQVHSRIATASKSGEQTKVQLWNIEESKPTWSVLVDAPVEGIAFRLDGAELATVGLDDTGAAILVEYSAADGSITGREKNFLDNGSVHLAFTRDGNSIIGDYDYASVVIWSISERAKVGAPLTFSGSGGIPFDLGYDLIKDLRNIRREGESLIGELPGAVVVRILQDGPGTIIKPLADDTPILSAYERGDARLYPVRGSDLVSSDGRWFALATNSTGVEYASSLRVFDLRSGLPVSRPLLHQVRGRPGDPWPRLLSSSDTEFDPIQAVAFVGRDADVVTVTTNGVLRRWSVESEGWEHSNDEGRLGAQLTGRELISARYVRRLPRTEYAQLLKIRTIAPVLRQDSDNGKNRPGME